MKCLFVAVSNKLKKCLKFFIYLPVDFVSFTNKYEQRYAENLKILFF